MGGNQIHDYTHCEPVRLETQNRLVYSQCVSLMSVVLINVIGLSCTSPKFLTSLLKFFWKGLIFEDMLKYCI